MSKGGRHRLGESALDRVGMSEGGRCRLGESAIDRARGVEEVTDWESLHFKVKAVLERETPTGRERT